MFWKSNNNNSGYLTKFKQYQSVSESQWLHKIDVIKHAKYLKAAWFKKFQKPVKNT